jgi:hypothetical protein
MKDYGLLSSDKVGKNCVKSWLKYFNCVVQSYFVKMGAILKKSGIAVWFLHITPVAI